MSQTLDLDDLNDLNDDVVIEVDVKEALKSSIFIVQKAAAPKSGVEFRQGSIGTIRSSLATSYYFWSCGNIQQIYSDHFLNWQGALLQIK